MGVGCFVPIKQRKQKHAGAGTMIRINDIDSNKSRLEGGIAYVFVEDEAGRTERVGRVLAMDPFHHGWNVLRLAVCKVVMFSDAERM